MAAKINRNEKILMVEAGLALLCLVSTFVPLTPEAREQAQLDRDLAKQEREIKAQQAQSGLELDHLASMEEQRLAVLQRSNDALAKMRLRVCQRVTVGVLNNSTGTTNPVPGARLQPEVQILAPVGPDNVPLYPDGAILCDQTGGTGIVEGGGKYVGNILPPPADQPQPAPEQPTQPQGQNKNEMET